MGGWVGLGWSGRSGPEVGREGGREIEREVGR